MRKPQRPVTHDRMFLMCYEDRFTYGWHHVDLFVHDEHEREVSWVHWTVEEAGPDAAEESLRQEEPDLKRTSPWRVHDSAFGMTYWVAEAEWPQDSVRRQTPTPSGPPLLGSIR